MAAAAERDTWAIGTSVSPENFKVEGLAGLAANRRPESPIVKLDVTAARIYERYEKEKPAGTFYIYEIDLNDKKSLDGLAKFLTDQLRQFDRSAYVINYLASEIARAIPIRWTSVLGYKAYGPGFAPDFYQPNLQYKDPLEKKRWFNCWS